MEAPEVTTIVKVPLSRIASELKDSHSIRLELASAAIEDGCLVLTFSANGSAVIGPTTRQSLRLAETNQMPRGTSVISHKLAQPMKPRRRRLSRRNRMKTRGWNIVAKITNSKGQAVAIYEPFVLALRGKKLRRRELAKLVSETLVANGNRPGPASVEYYLSNTLEYLAKEPTA